VKTATGFEAFPIQNLLLAQFIFKFYFLKNKENNIGALLFGLKVLLSSLCVRSNLLWSQHLESYFRDRKKEQKRRKEGTEWTVSGGNYSTLKFTWWHCHWGSRWTSFIPHRAINTFFTLVFMLLMQTHFLRGHRNNWRLKNKSLIMASTHQYFLKQLKMTAKVIVLANCEPRGTSWKRESLNNYLKSILAHRKGAQCYTERWRPVI
jgi:hypothetical protein